MGLWVVEELGDRDFSRPEAQETQGVRVFADGETIDRAARKMGTDLCGARALWEALV